MSVCRTITVYVQPICPTVLYVKILLLFLCNVVLIHYFSYILSVRVQLSYFVLVCQAVTVQVSFPFCVS